MEYLNHVLGIRVIYKNDKPKPMPNYIFERYRTQIVTLDGNKSVFVYPKAELDSINSVKKHMERIRRAADAPAVLVPKYLTYRQKEYLLRDHIPFIVEGRQIYLPYMAIYLQERCDRERQETKAILPSAQVLLLYYIYHGCGELSACAASQALSFTATSISRASRQLEEMALIQTKKRGVQKVIFSNKTSAELFSLAKSCLMSPVKRTIYVPKAEIRHKLLVSGYSALSEYSMLNPPEATYLATDSITEWDRVSSGSLQNSDDQCAVELWRYNPKKSSDGEYVDRLSLALALREDKDERIEEAIEEMLAQVWREIDGTRD